MTDVDPQEAQAVREALSESLGASEPAEVVQRDFRRPLRLSREARGEIVRAAERVCSDVSEVFTQCLGQTCTLAYGSLSEANAEGLFSEVPALLATTRFRMAGQTSWLVWQPANALAAVETLLGSPATTLPTARPLTQLEVRVLNSLLGEVLTRLVGGLGGEVLEPELVQEPKGLGGWRDDGEGADAHRLTLELALRVGNEDSTLLLHVPYLPETFDPGARLLTSDKAPTLPTHLERVEVEVLASFDGGEFNLSQLLALEKGDVLPIDARVGDPVLTTVDGKPMALASLGAQNGQKAVRIDGFEVDKGLTE